MHHVSTDSIHFYDKDSLREASKVYQEVSCQIFLYMIRDATKSTVVVPWCVMISMVVKDLSKNYNGTFKTGL